MSLNLAALKSSFAKNKLPFALAGVAAVGVVAWRARTAKTAATTTAPLAAGTTAYPASTSPGYTSPGYSSTSSDVYSAIQPQLEAIGQTQAQLQAMMGNTQTPPIPVPAAPPDRNQVITGLYQQYFSRAPMASELASWDANPASTDAISQNLAAYAQAHP